MVDLTTTQAQAKGVILTISHEGGGGQHHAFTKASQNVAAVATLLDMLPPPSVDGVDRLYCQLGRSSPLLLRRRWSAPASVGPGTEPLARSTLGPTRERSLRNRPR
jgi:hypothetical protein